MLKATYAIVVVAAAARVSPLFDLVQQHSNKSFQFSERRRARPTAPRRGGKGGGCGHDRDHDRDRDRTRDRDRARDTRHHTATPRRRRRLRARLAALERSTSGAIPPAAAIVSSFAALLAARFRSARAACSCAPAALDELDERRGVADVEMCLFV